MSQLPERVVRFGEEASWGTPSTTISALLYALSFEGTSREVRGEEEIVATSRQARARSWLQKEVTGSFEFKPVTPLIFYFALGGITEDTQSPYTMSEYGTLSLPSFTIENILRGTSNTIQSQYIGCKVDRLTMRITPKEDIRITVDFAAKDHLVPSYEWSTIAPTSDQFTLSPFEYYEAKLYWGTSTISLLSLSLEANNNLEAVYTDDTVPTRIVEGYQEISGALKPEESQISIFRDFLRSRSEGTIDIRFGDSRGTTDIYLYKVALDEYVDRTRGRDMYEVEFPFKARASGPARYDSATISFESLVTGYGEKANLRL